MKLFEVRHLSSSNLSDLSFSLSASELVCLSGPSGTGKTLMLRSLADLDVSQGSVYLQGVQREQMPPTEWRRQVGYLAAESRWWSETVGEHFPRVQADIFSQLGFEDEVLGWQAERLSSGERQRLALARLLSNQPRILLLDEPTANLDPVNTQRVERLVTDYLRRNRAACLWVTHAADQIERIAGRVLYLYSHGLAEEKPA
ncbi:MAG: ATP-binding cassette domain-containing protein [Thiogranum sp.]